MPFAATTVLLAPNVASLRVIPFPPLVTIVALFAVIGVSPPVPLAERA